MDVDLIESALFSHLYKREKMVDIAVNAAVGQKTHDVEFFAVFLRAVHSVYERGIFKEIAVFDRLGYSGEFLIDYPARADIQVTDLAVAHLSFGETDRETACV